MLQSTTRRFLAPRSLPALQNLRQFQTSTRFCQQDPFDPKKTRPEEESGGKEDAKNGYGTGAHPTDPSANKARDPQEGGGQGSPNESGKGNTERSGQSSGGSPPKAGGVKSGGGGGT